MATFYPVCVTIAFFIALLLFDVMERTPEKVNSHIFLGLVTTFLMVYLSFKDMEIVSWGLLLIPVVVLVTCYFLGYVAPAKIVAAVASATANAAASVSPAPTNCAPAPTISNPEAIATAQKIVSDSGMCNSQH
jgi:hypothetical protein